MDLLSKTQRKGKRETMTSTEDINRLIAEELGRANAEYPLFHSQHEAFAVILEEVDEVKDEFEDLKSYTEALWKQVRRDGMEKWVLEGLQKSAVWMIKEAIQVAAMCEKALQSGIVQNCTKL